MSLSCPLLAIQSVDDEYGTLEQIRRLRHAVPHAQLLELADCLHSPHRDQAGKVISAAMRFLTQRGATPQE